MYSFNQKGEIFVRENSVNRLQPPSAIQSGREFKIQQRGRQRERQRNNRFNKQNNNFARASHFFVHFFPVFARLRPENASFRVS